MISVKICGITSESDLEMAIEAGADIVGFVLVESSPRFVNKDKAQALIQRAAELGAEPWVVATLAVPFLDELVEETLEIAAVQLHGKESPAQVASFVKRHPLAPVIKAMGVASKRDLDEVAEFEAADGFLFDAKPPKGADREGGHGKSFDWSILKGFRVNDHEDWTLSGGLTAQNVGEAIRRSGAGAVDVSSSVEKSPGVKDKAKVEAFIKAAKAAG
ncbi:MAG TPA: phosphoribosylanthranilate isomerase [Hyphomonadaceae bacterium]|nr:phosphoribosylanthranilate isomerase [Hyphomonadaceae bacterium]HPN05649.1 phosphoribosylanthranilate isomerase [Hyphomonadaceae bacterium]